LTVVSQSASLDVFPPDQDAGGIIVTTPTTTPPPGPAERRSHRALVRRALQLGIQCVAFGAILFTAAGTLHWWNGWAFLALFLALLLTNAAYVLPRNPELIAERGRSHPGTRRVDTTLMTVYTICYLGLFVLAGLDSERFGWAHLGWPWALAGATGIVLGDIPIAGAMAVNRHLETTVRIQSDRGHQVVTDGPYRWVRHPMYVGMLIQLPATALVLGSAWALLPALGCALIMLARTAMEDRLLLRDLPGYPGYARRTRYRLARGVW
jgi:protein-S-isoprenylcysteine O-methyltransferase Ste14